MCSLTFLSGLGNVAKTKFFKPGKESIGKESILTVSGFRLPAGFFVSFSLNDKTRISLIIRDFEKKRGQFLREPDPACYNAGFSPVSYFEYTPLGVERGTCGKSGSRFRETRVITSQKKGAVRMKTCLEGIETCKSSYKSYRSPSE